MAGQRLKLLCDPIAKGIVELGDPLGEQVVILKGERKKECRALQD